MASALKLSLYSTTALVIALGLLDTCSAYADGQEDSGEIVVTARRIEERLQDVPISVTVLNQRQLNDQNISSTEDLAKVTPSLSFNNSFGSDNTAFSLRGFFQDIGTAPTVGVFFADVVTPRGGTSATEEHAGDGAGPGSFFDLQNVQVLKGPQGTLFGRNTTGGDILLVPQKPKPIFEGFVETSFGNYGLEEFQGVVNVPINEKIRLRVGVDQEKRDGYLNNISGVGPDNFDDINYVAGRVSLVVDLTDDLENYTIASFSQSDTNGPGVKITGCFPPTPSEALSPLTSEMACNQMARDKGPYTIENGMPNAEDYSRKWQVINTTTWNATDDLTVKNIASYSQFQNRLANAVYGDNSILPATFPTGFFGFPFPVPTGTLAGQHIFQTDTDSPPGLLSSDEQTFTEEIQAHVVAFDGKLDGQVGAYMEASHPLDLAGTEVPEFLVCSNYAALQCVDPIYKTLSAFSPLIPPIGTVQEQYGTITYRDYAVYGQGTYSIFDNLKFTGGIRYTKDSEVANLHLLNYYFPGVVVGPVCEVPGSTAATNCQTHIRTASHAPTWVMDLDWTPVEDLLTYVKYSRGYRQGGINPNGPVDPSFGNKYLAFQPEQVDTYEVGLKETFRGAVSGTFDFAGFYNDFSNQQVPALFVASTGAEKDGEVNAGTSRIWGIEVNATLKPIKDLVLSAGYTYLNSEIQDVAALSQGSLYTSLPSAVAGSSLTFTPHNKLAFTATYYVPLDPDLGKLSVGSTFTYTGAQAVEPTFAYGWLKQYSLLNFNVNWEGAFGQPLDIEFFMTNALNRYYYTYVADYANIFGYLGDNIGEPRMFGGRLRYHFGGAATSHEAEEPVAPPPPPAPPPAPVAAAPEAQRQFQVFFDFDKSDITSAAAEVVAAAADTVKSGHIATVAVTGHTDTVGTVRYNQALSERRAAAVKAALVADGVPADEISATGVGKSDLLVPTKDGVREPQNRRAVVLLQQPGA